MIWIDCEFTSIFGYYLSYQINFFALEEENMIPQELLRQKLKIMKSNPNSQTISYYTDTWRKHLGSNPYFGIISNKFPGEISRGDLFQLAAQAKQSNDLNDIMILFISTMIWGYGTTGYGAWRTSEMLSSPNAEDIIKQTFELIKSNNIIEAYNIQRLKRCGPPFFTKYFYFIGFGCNLLEYPLILDTKVYNALKDKIKIEISQFVKASTWWYPEGYISYVQSMHNWAKSLEVEAHNIEYFLFSIG